MTEIQIEAVPGVVAVVIGCPDGCGEQLVVPVDEADAEPASRGATTVHVRITAGAVVRALSDHLAQGLH